MDGVCEDVARRAAPTTDGLWVRYFISDAEAMLRCAGADDAGAAYSG